MGLAYIKLGPLSPTDICGGKQNYLPVFPFMSHTLLSVPHTTPMASLSFNTTRIRTPTLQSHKPISKFSSLAKPIKVSFTFLTKPSRRNQQKLHPIRSSSVSESSVFAPKEVEFDDDDEEEDDPTAELSYLDPEADPGSISEWELDFCSRPILDIRGKKLWELVCLSLLLWLEERYEAVYMRHPGFQKGSKPLLALDNPFPMELPENLFGEKWAFVQLPISAVREEVSSLETRLVFGAGLDLDLLGIEIDDKTLIPGLAVATSRARPLAAWMNGLEVCSIEAELSRASLILSVGISTRYIYATYKKTPVTTNEAEAWEAAKKACGGLHFLAIQEDLDSDDCVGFWLLLDLPPPPV
nr:protein tab2 like, chloroplastic [Quercus suber]